MAPTVLDYAGIIIPEEVQGKSLKPFTQGDTEDWRTEFLCEHLYELPYIPKSEGIRTEQWKYFRYIDHPETEELYNLAEDPLELVNLINDPSQRKRIAIYRQMLDDKIASLQANRVK